MATGRRPSHQCHSNREDVAILLKTLELSSSSSSNGDINLHKTSPASSNHGDEDPQVCGHKSVTSAARKDTEDYEVHVVVEEASTEGVVDIQKKKEARIPKLERLQDSDSPPDTMTTSPSRTSTQEETIDLAVAARTVEMMQTGMQGFLFGQSPKKLLEYLINIVSCPRDYGIYISDKLTPRCVEGVYRYRKDHEYKVEHQIHGLPNEAGVYLCRDWKSKQKFVLKRIRKHHHRLTGLEFLSEHGHDKSFLPKVYGVYKDGEEIYIFQEYVEGGTLLKCHWDICQIRDFAETLLLAFSYLHSLDLVHGDVKLMNIMVRNLKDPKSAVVIDFESAKHPHYPYRSGGYTLLYLPPWFEKLFELDKYDPLLKTMDLWAIGCILVWFLTDLSTGSVERSPYVWTDQLTRICKACKSCSPEVQQRGVAKGFTTPNESWAFDRLRELLFYLTDTSSFADLNVDEALSI
ncbi:hypothetical protein BaRGS_00013705, partial [Batillaria attramentaria]